MNTEETRWVGNATEINSFCNHNSQLSICFNSCL